jgi:hypothetical protein
MFLLGRRSLDIVLNNDYFDSALKITVTLGKLLS